jgi:phosphoglycolate phosphatase
MDASIPRLCAFDLDGTLVDSRADIALAANLALADVGLPPRAEDEVRTFVGHGARRLMERCVWPRTDRTDPALRAWRLHYGRHLLDRTVPYPGVLAALDALRPHVLLAVATNKPAAFGRRICDALFPGRIAAVIGGDEAPFKPDPAMIVRLGERFGIAPGRTVFVGDMDVDERAARAAGVGFVGVGWGFTPTSLAGDVAQTPAELVPRVLAALGIGRGGSPPAT